MSGERQVKKSKLHIIVAIIVLTVVFIGVIFSPNQFTPSYIDDFALSDLWTENPVKRDEGSSFFGLEKWNTYTYEKNDSYPSYLTITTIKSLVMMDESDLKDKTIEAIFKAEQDGFEIDNGSMISGWRVLKNKHKTLFFIYNGTRTTENPGQKIKIIGEVWNCGVNGISVICIGFSQITKYGQKPPGENFLNWNKIIRDVEGTFGMGDLQGSDGLIYNIICH